MSVRPAAIATRLIRLLSDSFAALGEIEIALT
jgi:hypothetical protein